MGLSRDELSTKDKRHPHSPSASSNSAISTCHTIIKHTAHSCPKNFNYACAKVDLSQTTFSKCIPLRNRSSAGSTTNSPQRRQVSLLPHKISQCSDGLAPPGGTVEEFGSTSLVDVISSAAYLGLSHPSLHGEQFRTIAKWQLHPEIYKSHSTTAGITGFHE